MSQDVVISDDEEEHDPNHYHANVLVADDNPVVLKDLVGHMSYIKGPDMKYQSCDFTDDGTSLVQMYKDRLQLAKESNWNIKPYQVIITDLHMPSLNGL